MQDRQLERLRQIVVGARTETLRSTSSGRPRAVSIRTGTNCPARRSSATTREPVDARQHHVEDDQIEAGRVGRQPRERLFAGVDHLDVVLLGLEVEAQAVGEVLLVFDDRIRLIAAADSGSCTVNVLPRPGPSLSANTLPPWRAITERTMNSPRPVPLTRVAHRAGNAVEALEDPLQLGRRDADALIAHAQRGRAPARPARAPPRPAPAGPST